MKEEKKRKMEEQTLGEDEGETETLHVSTHG